MNKVAVPGSFDPMTLGHFEIVKKCAAAFPEVVVIVADNANKKYLFSAEQRVEIAKALCGELPNVSVCYCDSYVVNFASSLGCKALVKGIRNETDLRYEMHIKRVNEELCPEVITLFMGASDEYAELSSTKVRQMISENADLCCAVGDKAARLISEYAK